MPPAGKSLNFLLGCTISAQAGNLRRGVYTSKYLVCEGWLTRQPQPSPKEYALLYQGRATGVAGVNMPVDLSLLHKCLWVEREICTFKSTGLRLHQVAQAVTAVCASKQDLIHIRGCLDGDHLLLSLWIKPCQHTLQRRYCPPVVCRPPQQQTFLQRSDWPELN